MTGLLARVRDAGGDIEFGEGQRLTLSAPDPMPPALIDELRQRRGELLAEVLAERAAAQRERMRAAVLAELDRCPTVPRAWLAEHDDEGDVIVAFAIRGLGTAFLWVDGDRFDGIRMLELIASNSEERVQ